MIKLETILNNCTDAELDKVLDAACTITEIFRKNGGTDSTHLMIESEPYAKTCFIQICSFDEIRNREKGLKEHK